MAAFASILEVDPVLGSTDRIKEDVLSFGSESSAGPCTEECSTALDGLFVTIRAPPWLEILLKPVVD